MSQVDPDDDNIRRLIVRHYRYDPDRHERRHLLVAAFDNEREFDACLEAMEAELSRRRERGDAVDPREHVSGVVHEPGHRRRQQNARILVRASRHGVVPANWHTLDLPSNVAILSAGRPERTAAAWRRLLRWLPGRRR
ncbi:MAG TPA: hypothetical protein VII16_08460 [Actinomycetes bacterium]